MQRRRIAFNHRINSYGCTQEIFIGAIIGQYKTFDEHFKTRMNHENDEGKDKEKTDVWS